MLTRILQTAIRAPGRTVGLFLLFAAATAVGGLFIRFDFSPESVFSGQQEAIAFAEEHKATFRYEDSVLLVGLNCLDQENLLADQRLHWLDSFGRKVAGIEGVEEVESLLTIERPRIRLRGDNRIEWRPFLNPERLSDADFVEQKLQQLPALNDLLISADRRTALVVISLSPDQRKIDRVRAAVTAVQSLIERHAPPEGTEAFLSGVPAIRADVVESLMADQQLMVPACTLLFLVVSVVIFRSIRMTFFSVLAVLASVGLTAGIMGWTGQEFHLLSNAVPALVLIIGAANTVHIVCRAREVIRENGSVNDWIAERERILLPVMQEMTATCAITLGTTAIGFGSLILARAGLLQSFAMQSVLGMACNYVSLILLLTAGLSHSGWVFLSRQNNAEPDGAGNTRGIAGSCLRMARLTGRCPIPVIVAHLAVIGAGLWVSRDQRINSYMLETYDSDNPVMGIIHKLETAMSGLVSMEIRVTAENPEQLWEYDVIRALAEFRSEAENDDRITFYRDYSLILASVDDRILSLDSQQFAAGIRQLERSLPILRERGLPDRFLSTNPVAGRIMLRVRDIGSRELLTLGRELEARLEDRIPKELSIQVTGDAWLHAVCMDRFVSDLFLSVLAASVVIFLVISTIFRSLRIGLVASVPNLFPLLVTLGYMSLRGYELTAGNVIVFAIGLGIAVDDTIHLLARYRHARDQGNVGTDAVRDAVVSCGPAIVMTSLLIVGGLSVLLISQFVPTRRFAELTAVTMGAALPGDLLLLPALLVRFGSPSPKTHP